MIELIITITLIFLFVYIVCVAIATLVYRILINYGQFKKESIWKTKKRVAILYLLEFIFFILLIYLFF